ncbi:MAG: zinc-ribbon domain containing protein [Clostridia bacterium]|nr:zinc-ribbon domain containing protein [Clostridia bacterium]
MKQRCIQCGREFNLSDSEIDFYKSKSLNLPKRCKSCRDKNKRGNQEFKKYNLQTPIKNRSTFLSSIITFLIFINAICITNYGSLTLPVFFIDLLGVVAIVLLSTVKNTVEIQEFDTSPYKHTFYDTKSMAEHYAKHGKETGCGDMEEYLFKANYIIGNKSVISKTQKKDGDTAYFNTATNEFVVVAKAGYIRTYFIASLSYYNKQ